MNKPIVELVRLNFSFELSKVVQLFNPYNLFLLVSRFLGMLLLKSFTSASNTLRQKIRSLIYHHD